jgi:hypothetical protein
MATPCSGRGKDFTNEVQSQLSGDQGLGQRRITDSARPLFIQRSAWKVNSPKLDFRFTEFWEVRLKGILRSSHRAPNLGSWHHARRGERSLGARRERKGGVLFAWERTTRYHRNVMF